MTTGGRNPSVAFEALGVRYFKPGHAYEHYRVLCSPARLIARLTYDFELHRGYPSLQVRRKETDSGWGTSWRLILAFTSCVPAVESVERTAQIQADRLVSGHISNLPPRVLLFPLLLSTAVLDTV